MKQLFKVVKGHGASKEAVDGKTFEKKADAKKLRDSYMKEHLDAIGKLPLHDQVLARQRVFSHDGAYRVVPAKDHIHFQEKK